MKFFWSTTTHRDKEEVKKKKDKKKKKIKGENKYKTKGHQVPKVETIGLKLAVSNT